MANENLGLKIIASLDFNTSLKSVNGGIKALAKHPSLQKLNIQINVDQNFIKSINGFIESTKKLSVNLDAQNKVIKETVNEYKNLDGSITKTTQQVHANGELVEKSKTKHDANKKALQDESKAYEAQRKTLDELEASLNGYTKASTKANYNKSGQINSITNTYKNENTGKTVTVNSDVDGNVNNYAKLSEYLKLQQSTLAQEQIINKQREQVAKEEYNNRKAIADKGLKEEEQRNKQFENTLRQRYEFEQNQVKKSEALDKAHYQALQQNQKREQQYAQTMTNTQQKISDAKSKYSGNSSAIGSLNELEAKLKSISNIGDFKSPLTNLNNELKRTLTQLNEGTGHARSFGDTLKSAFSNIAMYAGVGSAFMQIQRFFSEGISYVNELNKSLTELSIVYMEGQDEVEKYATKFHKLGMEMGLTTGEIAKGAVEFARQGLDQTETFNRMESAIKYAKISSIDFTTSAKILTATVNSMNVSIERASDVYSYLGDATASGADEIGEAMQRVGGTAGAIGVEFEKVSSWVATMSANSRESAYTLGNAVKSILARMQSLKESGFDEEDGTKVNDVAKALATIGVQLMDAQGNFRDFGTVMDDIGGKWDSLTNRQQGYIATAMAGSFQSAKFLGLMSDYGQSVELYKGALDSAGISTEKFNLYQQGTEAHLNKLKTAMEGLWASVFQSDTIRSVIDATTSLLSVLDSIAKKFGGVQTVVAIATASLLLFNKGLRMGALSTFGIDLKAVALATQIFTGSTIAARVAVTALQATMTLGLSVAIAGVVAGLTHLLNKHREQKELNEQIAQQNKTIVDSWNTQKNKVNELIATYTNLQTLTKNGSVFTDIEQEEKYKRTIEELAGLMPNLVQSIDEKGNKHLKNADAIKQELLAAEALTEATNKQTVLDAESNFGKQVKAMKELQQQIGEIQAKIALGGTIMANGMGGASLIPFTESDLNKFQIQILTLQSKVATASGTIKEDLTSITKNILDLSGTKIDNTISNQIAEITNSMSLQGLNGKEISDKAYLVADFIKKLQTLKNTSSDSDQYQGLVSSIKNIGASFDATDYEVQKIINSLNEAQVSVSSIVPHTDEVNEIMKDLTDTFKNATDSVSPLNAAIQKLKEGKSLTADEITNLIEKVDGFSSAVTTENGVLKVNLKAVTNLRNESVKSSKDILEAKKKQVDELEKQTYKELEKYGIQIDGIKSVAEAMQALTKKKEEVDRNMYTLQHDPENKDASSQAYMESLKRQKEEIAATEESLNAIDAAKKQLNALRGIYNPLLNSVGESTDSNKESNDKLNDSYSDTVEILTELQKRMEVIDKLRDAEIRKRSRLRKDSKEYQDSLKKENDLLKEKIKLGNEGIKDPSKLVATKVTTTTKTNDSSSSASSSTNGNATNSNKSSTLNNMFSAFSGLEGKFTYSKSKSGGTYDQFVNDAISDCSLFVQQMFKEFMGVDLGRDTSAQFKKGTTINKIEDLQAGDLVFFDTNPNKSNGHVGIYKGNGKFEHVGVKSGLSEQNINSDYWSSKFTSGKRVLSDSQLTNPSTSSGKTTTKDGNTTVKTDSPTQKDMADAVEAQLKQNNETDDQIYQNNLLILESIKEGFDRKIQEQEDFIYASKRTQEKLDPNSVEWRKENEKQVNAKGNIQGIQHGAKTKLQAEMKKLGIESNEWDDILKKLSSDWLDVQSEKYALLIENFNSQIDSTKQRISDLDNLIEQSKNRMSKFDIGSPEYNKELNIQIELTKKQNKENENLKKSLEALANSTKLDPATRKKFKEMLDELNLKDYTSDIKDLNAELIDSKSTPLSKEIDDLNHKLDVSKATLKGFKEGTEDYNVELKNQLTIIDELVIVTKKLKDYAETQSKNEELSASVREDYKKQVQELTMSLYDYADSLKSIREEYADNVIEKYKKMLQEQQKLRNAAYDKEKEAEDARHEARMSNLDDEMSKFEEVINAQSKSFDREVAAEDYTDQLAKLQKEKAELDSKFSSKLLDDSLEGKMARADLQKEIDAKQEEITKLQRDREITIRKEGLSDQLEDRKAAVDKEKKLEDDKNKLILKGIEEAKKKNDEYYDGLLNDEQYFYNMKQNLMSEDTVKIQSELDKIKIAYDEFFNELEKNSAGYAEKIKANLKYSVNLDKDYSNNFPINDKSNTAGGTGNVAEQPNNTTPVKSMNRNAAWNEYLSNKQKAEQLLIEMKTLMKDSTDYKNKQSQFEKLNSTNIEYRTKYGFQDGSYAHLSKITKYHEGGIVGQERTTTKSLLEDNEIPAILKAGEGVIKKPRDFFKEIAGNVMNNLSSALSSFNVAKIFNKNTQAQVAPVVHQYEINIDRVIGTEKDARQTAATIGDILSFKQKQGR